MAEISTAQSQIMWRSNFPTLQLSVVDSPPSLNIHPKFLNSCTGVYGCRNQWLQLMPLWNSQSSALKATSPTKHWLTWPAACQELEVSARNTGVDLDLFPVPHCHPWVQHHQLHLSPYQSKTFHKSPTPLKFPLFSWPAATSNLQ